MGPSASATVVGKQAAAFALDSSISGASASAAGATSAVADQSSSALANALLQNLANGAPARQGHWQPLLRGVTGLLRPT